MSQFAGLSSFQLAAHYVDVRTRALAYWFKYLLNGDYYSLVGAPRFHRSGYTNPIEATQKCRDDLRAQLTHALGLLDRYEAEEGNTIRAALDFFGICVDEEKLDELRAMFHLPVLAETREPQELPEIEWEPARERRRSGSDRSDWSWSLREPRY